MGNGDGTFTPTYDIFPFYIWGYPQYEYSLDGSGTADLVEVVGASSSLQTFKGGPAPALQIALNDSVVTGNSDCGYVFPNLPTNSSTTATLSSSVAGVLLPASVTIPANAASASFCFSLATNFDWHQVFDVNAKLNGSTATTYASDSYALGFSEALSAVTPSALYSGQSTNPVTVTLTSSQSYSSTANLYCEGLLTGDSCQFADNVLSVSPTGPSSTTVIFVTAANAFSYGSTHPFTVAADDGNIIQRQTAIVNVANLQLLDLPSQIQSSAGGTTSIQLGILGIPPYTLSCSGLPAGATCTYSGTQAPYPSASTLTLTVAVPSGTALGNYPFQVTLASGTVTTSAASTLQVIAFSVQDPSANSQWGMPGAEVIIPITASVNPAESGDLTISCAFDAGGVCSGGSVPASVTPQNVSLSVNVPSNASIGQHVLTVTATYGTTSQNFTFPFIVATFSGSLSSSSVTLAAGASTPLTATLNPTTGFVGTVTLSCSGATQITCTFQPASTPLTGGTPQNVNITLTANSNGSSKPVTLQFFSKQWLTLAVLFPFTIVFAFRRRGSLKLLAIFIAMVLLMPIVSCSGGGGSSGGGGGGGGGSNSYTITVSASIPGATPVTLGTIDVTVTH
jgi:hypothetical protein